MKNIVIELKNELNNGCHFLKVDNCEIDYYRNCLNARSYMIIKYYNKNGVEEFWHIPTDEILSLKMDEK